MEKNEVVRNIERVMVWILGICLFLFPLVFSTVTTESFVLPKQILLGATVMIGLLLFCAKMIAEGKIRLRRTPFDLVLIAFTVIVFLSAMLSLNRADALTAFIPLLFSILLFFLLVNFTRESNQFTFVLTSYLLGTAVLALFATLSYFKIYVLPIALTKNSDFTSLGALYDQALYLIFALPIAWYLAKPNVAHLKEKSSRQKGIFTVSLVLVLVGLFFSLYQVISSKNQADQLVLLPFQTGFQTALASISQDTGRVFQGFLFGSGYGTYISDFTRFKPVSFNLDQNLWFITFFRSSSFALELLTTTGVLGIAAFVVLVIKALKVVNKASKRSPLVLSVVFTIIASFILPFSYNIVAVLFIILGLFSSYCGLFDHSDFFDVELDLVAFKKGLIETTEGDARGRKSNKFLPVTLFLIALLFCAVVGFFSVRYVMADMLFQKSLVSASQNKGVDTYNYEVNAIQLFPYRDGFYRIYSQTNLALANSIAAAQTPNTQIPAKTQQTVYTLIQQAINAGRSATTIAPLTSFNWENLSSIYRSLIGFGQNADTFAIAAEQQAIVLDQNNPQVYINLGGIYYQLAQWDNAQRQFQLAINLKSDYANAHYNLGHSLEAKGDLQGALAEYQTVQSLVSGNPQNLAKINTEIKAIEDRLGIGQKTQPTSGSNAQQPPLGISQPSNQLPPQKPPVKLPQ